MANPNIVTSPTKVTTVSSPDGYVVGQSSTDLIGFYGVATPVAKPTVTGSKGSNAALGSLMTALSNLGLVTDSTSA